MCVSDPDAVTGHFPPLISVTELPSLNAALNTLSAVFLCAGYFFVRAKKLDAHRMCMLSAVVCSTFFLISYLVYHYHVGSVPYQGQGLLRIIYFAVLLTHTILAAAVLPLALITLVRALRNRFDAHRRIARWTFPIWLYVSSTGVVVYLMLYVL
jgi:uncharacterized membrane protein YozB (DUF420 family)